MVFREAVATEGYVHHHFDVINRKREFKRVEVTEILGMPADSLVRKVRHMQNRVSGPLTWLNEKAELKATLVCKTRSVVFASVAILFLVR
jgi:hypothetical protein